MTSTFRRIVAPVVELRDGEGTTAVLLFAYSFLAMTAYNIVKPITRSKFISDLGADNLPWVQLGAGILIGIIMQFYSRAIAWVPRRWAVPVTQAGCIALLMAFWVLFTAGYQWASVGFYVLGLILGILLISQFWTLANDIYDPRQAKRLFGFIGGGSSLGGATGAAITAIIVTRVGTVNLLLVSAAILLVCAGLVIWIVQRERAVALAAGAPPVEEGVGGSEAITLLRESRHLQIIAIVIGCAAMGGAIIEQQLNMAAQARLGQGATDGITQFLAQVTVYLSLIGFVIQVAVTSRVHRLLGLGFALMILPVSLGTTAGIMLVNAGLWAPGLARVLDTSLRYTVDKTTREILFLPLPAAIKYRAKPFVDVTMDRFAKALGALLILVLIKPWGLALNWQQLSYASLTLTAIWIVMAIQAKREYLAVFRRSIERQDVEPAAVGATPADLQSIETLIEELAHPDEGRVLYAIDLLESLSKNHLVTPLLLHHASVRVRARTVQVLGAQPREQAVRWLPSIERLLGDEDAAVRAEAVRAVATISGEDARELMRRHLLSGDPRLVVTAAAALVAGHDPQDVDAAEAAVRRLLAATDETASVVRAEVARALGAMSGGRFRDFLVPLMLDADVAVARAAITSAGRLGIASTPDAPLFVPALVSLLGNRLLKEEARAVLTGFGDAAIEPLAYFLQDPEEDIWVRRHVPGTLARIPAQQSVDALIAALSDRDSLLRGQVLSALGKLRRDHPELAFPRAPIETRLLEESRRYGDALTLHANLVAAGEPAASTLLARALADQQARCIDRTFTLLGLIYPQRDIAAARYALERGSSRDRASASEYLDNVVTGAVRKRILLLLEDIPREERVRRARVLFRTRERDLADTLAQLIHDEDQVLVAAAVHMVADDNAAALADDLEFLLTHRDVRDWYVFEAASWKLAATRMPAAERREQWLEPLPAVEVADRLRGIPLFQHLTVEDLFLIAAAGRQVRFEPGRALCAAGRLPDALNLLIDGDAVRGGNSLCAPSAIAFDELLGAQPLTAEITASSQAITLSLTLDELLTLLSNNIELAHGLFRMLLHQCDGGIQRSRVLHGTIPDGVAHSATRSLSPVERSLILRGCPLLDGGSSDQLLRLAAIAREVPLVAGETLTHAGHPAMHLVVSGELVVEVNGMPPESVAPGDMVGAYATLTATDADERVTVTGAGTALCLDQERLFALLADRIDLLHLILSAASRQGQPAAVHI